jgi:integrase
VRQGELWALDWTHIDLPKRQIKIERSLDAKGTFVDPKSRAGKRTIPIPKILRQHLLAHRLRSGRSEGLVFRNTKQKPFNPGTAINRAKRAWKAAELQPIGMHECRHTFASLMIASGVNGKALSIFLGHANISITMDRYGHLMPGSETEAANRLDDYLEQAVGS